MFAAIHVPDFALQAVLRHEPELHCRPVALVDSQSSKGSPRKSKVTEGTATAVARSPISRGPSKSILLQLTQAACDTGVNIGMSPPQALARCREIIFKPRSPAQEQASNEVLLQVAFTF